MKTITKTKKFLLCTLVMVLIISVDAMQENKSNLQNLSAQTIRIELEKYNAGKVRPLLRGFVLKKGQKEELQFTNFEPKDLIYIQSLPQDLLVKIVVQLVLESDIYSIKEKKSFIQALSDRKNIYTYNMEPLREIEKIYLNELPDDLYISGISTPIEQIEYQSLLHILFRKNKLETLKFILGHIADFNSISWNVQDAKGDTPLHIAATKHNINLINYLIKHGSDVTIQNEEGKTPLLKALSSRLHFEKPFPQPDSKEEKTANESTKISQIIHSEGINIDSNIILLLSGTGQEIQRDTVNAQAFYTGDTVLHYAALYYSKDIVSLLIKLGADVNIQNINGDSPLHKAAEYGRYYIVELLLKNYADRSMLNERNLIALDKLNLKSGQMVTLKDPLIDAYYYSTEALLSSDLHIDPKLLIQPKIQPKK